MRSLREPADVPAEPDFGLLKTAIYLARPAAFQREMKTLQDGEKQAFGGFPLAFRVVHGVTGHLLSCAWNLRVFPDDAQGCQCLDTSLDEVYFALQ